MGAEQEFIYTPADFLGWAINSGWRPSRLPVGVVYTFQAPVTRHLVDMTDRFALNSELTVSNGTFLMTTDDAPAVLVACLNPGAASMATQLEHLDFLGDETRFAAIVGTAGALAPGHAIGEAMLVESAIRDDAISDLYLPRDDVVEADERFMEALHVASQQDLKRVRTWTVSVPYRSTASDVATARHAGAQVVEMEIATLYAVARSLGMAAAATVVVSDVNRVDGWEVEWRDTTGPMVRAIDATIEAMRSLAND